MKSLLIWIGLLVFSLSASAQGPTDPACASAVVYQSKQFEKFMEEFQFIINQYLLEKRLT